MISSVFIYVGQFVSLLVEMLFDDSVLVLGSYSLPLGYILIGFMVLWLVLNVLVITASSLGGMMGVMTGTGAFLRRTSTSLHQAAEKNKESK